MVPRPEPQEVRTNRDIILMSVIGKALKNTGTLASICEV
jgi:hypothetical protein